MRRIKDDIKNNNLKNLYLLYGEETYLRLQYRDDLKKAIVGDDNMNCAVFKGNNVSVPAIIDLAETLPFFAERRLIIIENTGLLKSGSDELEAYLKDFPKSTYFVINEGETDGRKSIFKTCSARGVAVEFTKQDENTLKTWIASMLKRAGKKMRERDIDHFLELTGDDMSNIRHEVDKLISYTGDREVVESYDVDTVTTRTIKSRVFEMVEAMGSRNRELAVSLYYDLLFSKETPIGILRLIARQFNLLLQAKDLAAERYSKHEIAQKLKLRDYVAGIYLTQEKKYDRERLLAALEACLRAEEDIMNGRMTDRLSVELLIVEFSE